MARAVAALRPAQTLSRAGTCRGLSFTRKALADADGQPELTFDDAVSIAQMTLIQLDNPKLTYAKTLETIKV